VPRKIPYQKFDSAQGFSIHYPEGWEVREAKKGMSIGFVAPLESEYDKFRENLTVSKANSIVLDIDKLVDNQLKELRRNFPSFTLIERKNIKLANGINGIRIIYTGIQHRFELKLLQIFIVKDLHLYLITFTSEENQYVKYQKTIKKMIDSFTIFG